MGILNYLPTFKVVEINRSTGQVAGHIIAQVELSAGATGILKTVSGVEFLENGYILGLKNDLTLEGFVAATHAQPFLAYTEELNTFIDGLKYFAVEEDADGEIYPRGIGLYVGDVFTTNNYDEDSTSAPTHAKVVAGLLTLQDAADVDTLFIVEDSTLPDGTAAKRFTYIGRSVASLVSAHAALTTADGVHGLS